VVAPDLKGFGDSEKPFLAANYADQVILQELKQFVEVLLDSDTHKRIVVIGHGLGGQIAWKLIETYPQLFSKFVSIATPHPTIWLKHVMRSWRSVFENRWFYECRMPLFPERELLGNDLEIIDKRFKRSGSVMDLSSYSNFDKEAYKYTFSRSLDWQGPVNYFRNLPLSDSTMLEKKKKGVCEVDTLFLVGNLDPGVSLEMVSQSAEMVSRFAVKIVDKSGHSPHQEQSDYVNSVISQFIKGDLSFMSKWSSMIKLVQ